MTSLTPFHIAFPVDDLEAARTFYGKGQAGEQATLFFLDPAGNALEFKAFADPSQLFAR